MSEALTAQQQDGLRQVVDLIDTHQLPIGTVKKALAEKKRIAKKGPDYKETSKGEMVMRLFTYLGGTLICAGLGVFINMIWDDIGSLSRVIITFGTGFVAYLCGLAFLSDKRLEKAATPAHILAFFLQPFGLFVLLKEYFDGNDPALGSMIVFGLLTIQQGLTFLKFRRPSILLFTITYLLGFAGAATEYYVIDRGLSALVWGIFLFFVTVNIHKREDFKDLTPLFYIVSTLLFFSGLYYFIGRTVFDPLGLSFALSLLLFAVYRESKTLYTLSLLFMMGYFCGGPGGGWEYWNSYNEITFILTGGSLVLTGYWLRQKTSYISLFPLWMFIGAEYIFGGAYSILHGTLFETLFVSLTALGIYAAILLRSRAVLAASVLSLITFIVSFSAEHFADTVGWPLLLIVIGFITLGCGFGFARLAGKIKTAQV